MAKEMTGNNIEVKKWVQIILMPLAVALVGTFGTLIISRIESDKVIKMREVQMQSTERIAEAQRKHTMDIAKAEQKIKILEIFSEQITSADADKRLWAIRLLKTVDTDLALNLYKGIIEDDLEDAKVRKVAEAEFIKRDQPDLIIESLTHSPEIPTTADTITFTVAVKNIGVRKAGSSTLALKVGGETRPAIYSVPALGPGERYRFQRRRILSAAQRYRNTATADFKKEVLESDENNNQETYEYRVVQPFN